MSENTNPSGAQTNPNENNPGTNQTNQRTFTQEEVNTLMATEKHSARRALLKELGFELSSGEDYKGVLAGIKQTLESTKTEQQRDKEAKDRAEAEKAAAEANALRLQTQVDVLMAGVKSEYVDDVIALVMSRVNDDNPVGKVLEEIKTKYPVFFGLGNNPQGTGSPTNLATGSNNGASGLGKRLAQGTRSAGASHYFKR